MAGSAVNSSSVLRLNFCAKLKILASISATSPSCQTLAFIIKKKGMHRIKFQTTGLIISFLFAFLSSSSQDIRFKRISDTKVVINEDTLINSKDSFYQKLFLSGKVEYEGKILNDKKEGRWTTYYEDGSLCKENYYSKGLQNGKFIWYFKNGSKQQEVDLINGKKHGEDKYWNIDGTLNSITKFENGEQIEIRVYKPNYVNSTDTTTYKGDVIWKKE